LLLAAAPALAGPENVTLPQYQNFTRYVTVDRPDIQEVRDIHANVEAAELAKVGQPLPSGAVVVMVHFKAQVDDRGDLKSN